MDTAFQFVKFMPRGPSCKLLSTLEIFLSYHLQSMNYSIANNMK